MDGFDPRDIEELRRRFAEMRGGQFYADTDYMLNEPTNIGRYIHEHIRAAQEEYERYVAQYLYPHLPVEEALERAQAEVRAYQRAQTAVQWYQTLANMCAPVLFFVYGHDQMIDAAQRYDAQNR